MIILGHEHRAHVCKLDKLEAVKIKVYQHINKTKYFEKMPRIRRPFSQTESNLLYDMYRRNGGLWDVIINDVRRGERLQQLPDNVQNLYTNFGEPAAVRRRVWTCHIMGIVQVPVILQK